MKKLLYISAILLLAGCSPKVTTPVIKTGVIISVSDTVVGDWELKVIWYYNDELKPNYKVLYPVGSLKPGSVFHYIEEK